MQIAREPLLKFGLPCLLSVVGLSEVLATPIEPVAEAAVLAALAPLPLIGRHRFPAWAALLAVSTIVLQAVAGVDLSQPIAPITVLGAAAYGLGARLPLRRALLSGLGLVALIVLSHLVQGGESGSDPGFGAVLTFGPLAMGTVLQSRQEALHRAAEAAREVAVAHERSRIARELHDLIAHTVSVMVVQANAAEQVLRTDPDRAQAAIVAVQQAGRDALSETALLLDLLREGPGESSPQPGLAELAGIVRSTPGLAVELHLDDALPSLPPGAELSVCRIVQESLTNVFKHSSSTRAQVFVTAADGGLRVRVEDPGPARHTDSLPGGHGLVGMHERVEMYGGQLRAGPHEGRGWLVEAVIPLDASA